MVSDNQRIKLWAYVKEARKEDIYDMVVHLFDKIDLYSEENSRLNLEISTLEACVRFYEKKFKQKGNKFNYEK